MSQKFDGHSPEVFQLSEREIESALSRVAKRDLDDIRFAQMQVRQLCADAAGGASGDIEVETRPGVVLGHKNMPVNSVGCYVPGGKYPMVASAHMGVVTAKVAGVQRILATVAARSHARGPRPHPAIVAAMHLGGRGRDLFSRRRAGGGRNRARRPFVTRRSIWWSVRAMFVAEAKRQLFGRVGIDLIRGPSETLVVADES